MRNKGSQPESVKIINLFIPAWEDPVYRFFIGRGEVQVFYKGGPASTIYELLLETEERDYLISINGRFYTRQFMLQMVFDDVMEDSDYLLNVVTVDDLDKLRRMILDDMDS